MNKNSIVEFNTGKVKGLFICLFRKEINQALKELDGDELSGWYWTSTEYHATYAWYLNLSSGTLYNNTKASNRNRVRAVSAFSKNNTAGIVGFQACGDEGLPLSTKQEAQPIGSAVGG